MLSCGATRDTTFRWSQAWMRRDGCIWIAPNTRITYMIQFTYTVSYCCHLHHQSMCLH